jgi:hypothetical protein
VTLVIAIAVAAVGLSASVAGAEVYRYVDENGVPHYSDSVESIPDRYRDQVADISKELEARPGIHVIPGMNGTPGEAGAETEDEAGSGSAESFEFDFEDDQAMGAVAEQLWDQFGMLLILGFLLLIPISLVISGLILMLACKLAAPETPGLGRAVAIVFVQGLVGAAVNGAMLGVALTLGVADDGSAGSVALDLLAALAAWAAYAGVLSSMANFDFARALWVMVVYLILAVVVIAVPIAIIVLLIAL